MTLSSRSYQPGERKPGKHAGVRAGKKDHDKYGSVSKESLLLAHDTDRRDTRFPLLRLRLNHQMLFEFHIQRRRRPAHRSKILPALVIRHVIGASGKPA